MRPIIVLGTCIGALLATLQPLCAQSSRGDAASGRFYAVNLCTGCHSVEPETDGLGRFAPDFTAVARRRSTTAGSLKAFLRSDHELMPNFNLKPTEIDDVVAYILSLRRR